MQSLPADRLLILDFGSQYTQLIARRTRELGVYCEVWPWDVALERITAFDPKGIILSGGPNSVTDANSPRINPALFEFTIPLLGICYGMQTLAQQLGGQVTSGQGSGEFGAAQLIKVHNNPLLHDLIHTNPTVWMSHGDHVSTLPPEFHALASTKDCPIAAMAHASKPWYGVQFHPEVTHTPAGKALLASFILSCCQCQPTWQPESIITQTIQTLQARIGSEEVILGLSGGVDSSVAALLLHRAIGTQLTCVFVDNGLLRLNESEQVMAMFAGQFGLNVIKIDAQARFLAALAGISDPEEKRRRIGHTFIEVFNEVALQHPKVTWLAQGTIYPDVIESAGGEASAAHVIKSHHNVGGLPQDMVLKLVEPLRYLFKDEVRHIGLELGLPHAMLYRHPFPGPGLGVRVLGEIHPEYCDILRQADAIFIAELIANDWYDKVSQAFAVFLPVRSVAVMGDGRAYDWVIALRAVQTDDFMTAHWAHLPYELLGKVSNRIINEVAGVSRVVYDVSGKPPATIEWE